MVSGTTIAWLRNAASTSSRLAARVSCTDHGGGARAGTPGEAAQDADALLLAVHWSRLDDVLGQAGDLSGKVVVSSSMPMNDDDSELVVAHTSSGAEELARRARGARAVSAFHTVPSEVLFGVFDVGTSPSAQASCFAATIVAPRRLPPRCSATWGSMRWTYRFERFGARVP
jgi:predicted dinucleotide-binding enzyme